MIHAVLTILLFTTCFLFDSNVEKSTGAPQGAIHHHSGTMSATDDENISVTGVTKSVLSSLDPV